jgi:hypothetical protein
MKLFSPFTPSPLHTPIPFCLIETKIKVSKGTFSGVIRDLFYWLIGLGQGRKH